MVDGMLGGIAGGATVAITIGAVDKFSKVFTRATTGIQKLSKIVATGAVVMGAALIGIGIGAVKAASEFETAFTGVRKTVDLSEKEFEDLENRFKTLSTEIPVTFVELAGIGEIAGQLGVEGVDNIARFTRTIADISVTTNLTAEQAATDFARFANIMNMPIDQVDKLGSVVVDLGNNLATTEAEIVTMGMRIAGAGSALDMTEGEVMAWAGALSSMGVRAEMGGTAISKFMINISSMVATNSPELEKFAEVAGMTSAEFTKAFEEDASKALQTFFTGLGQVEEQGGDVLLTLENLGITEVRLRDTVLRLAAGGDTLTDALGIQSTAWEENTALVEEAEKRYETFASQVEILKNESKLLFEELGKELIPVLVDLFKVVKDEVIPAIKPLIPIIGDFLVDAIKRIAPMLPKLTELLTRSMEIFMKLFDAIEPILEPLFDIGFVLIDAILDAIIPLLPAIKALADAFVPLLEILAPILQAFGDIVGFLAELSGGFLGAIFKEFGGLTGAVGSIFGFEKGGIVPSTGLAMVHKGETIIPANRSIGTTIYINNLNGFNARDIADTLQEELNKKI